MLTLAEGGDYIEMCSNDGCLSNRPSAEDTGPLPRLEPRHREQGEARAIREDLTRLWKEGDL
jgi:hypothetical protein